MPSTFWPRSELNAARADTALDEINERLARFEQQIATPPAPPAPKPPALTFDRQAFMPWLSETATTAAAPVQQMAQQATSWLPARESLMPWLEPPAPIAATTPASGVAGARPAAAGGQLAAMPTGGQVYSGPRTGGSHPEQQALAYQEALASGLDQEGAQILVAVTETEGGLTGNIGDEGQSSGGYQFHERGEMPGFRAWLQKQGIQGDPRELVHDIRLTTRYAATGYLGRAIAAGRARGLSGADLATYVQETGQRSVNPAKTGQNYQRLYGGGASPTAGAVPPPAPAAPSRTPAVGVSSTPPAAGAPSPAVPGMIRIRRIALSPGGGTIGYETNVAPADLERMAPEERARWQIVGDMQKAASEDMPSPSGMSAGDQKRAKLAAASGQPQPTPEQATEGERFVRSLSEPGPERFTPSRNIGTYPDPAEMVDGGGMGTEALSYRQPLNRPTMGADTGQGEYIDPDSGSRESGYTVPPDPTTYGASGDDPGYTGAGGSAGRAGSMPAPGPPEIWNQPGTPTGQGPAASTPSPADDPGGAGFAAQDAYSQPAPAAATPRRLPVWNSQGEVVGYQQEDAAPQSGRIQWPNERPLAPEAGDTGVIHGPEPVPEPPSRWAPEAQAALQGTAANPAPTEPRVTPPAGPIQQAVSSAGRSPFLNESAAQQAVDIYSAIQELPFDVYERARQQLVSDAEAQRMAGTDPLAPFRGLGIALPSAEDLNPEGRPASDVAAGLLIAGALPDPTDPVIGTALRAAGKTLGLTARGVRAGARALGNALPAAQVADDGVRMLGSGVVPQGRRMYHGTGAAFGRPDPGKFDENGLFGPGYYLTSDTRVASSYGLERGRTGKVSGEQLQAYLNDIAAQTRRTGAAGAEDLAQSFERAATTVDPAGSYVSERAQRIFSDGAYGAPSVDMSDPQLWGPARASRKTFTDDLFGPTGANVRAIDVPKGLRLLEAEEQMKPAAVRRLAAKLAQATGSRYFADLAQTSNADMGYLSRSYAGMMTEWRNTEPGVSWARANQALAAAGYDGLQHTGGKRVPMMDADGKPIEHDVTIVFPESLDKIRNAFSGEAGGSGVIPSIVPGLRAPLANAAQGAFFSTGMNELDAQQQGRETSPEERARLAVVGAGLGLVAGNRTARRALGNAVRGSGRAADGVETAAQRVGSGVIPEEYGRAYPPIRGNVNDLVRHQLGDESAEMLADSRFPRDRVPPDMQASIGPVDDAPRTYSLGSGFVPADDAARAQQEMRAGGSALPGMEDLAADRFAPARNKVKGATPGQSRKAQIEMLTAHLPPDVARAVQAAEQRAQRMADKGVTRPSVWDWIKAAGYSGIYSPATAVSSTVGGATELALSVPKEAVRALVEGRPIVTRASARAQIGNVTEGITNLGRVLAGDASGSAKASGGSQGTAGLSDRVTNPAAHMTARVLEKPGEILTEAPDAVFRPLFRSQGMEREASRVARESQLPRGQRAAYAERLIQDAQAVRSGELPTMAETQRVLDAGEKHADDLGYKGKPGQIGQWLASLARRDDAVGVAASFLMPFPAMAARMSGAAIKSTPGAALIPGVRKMYPSRFDMVYDQALGTVAATSVAYWAMNGGITGSGPADAEQRAAMVAQGWQPNSVLIAGHYIPNRLLGRFQAMFDTAGELHDGLAYGKADRTAPQIAAELVKRGSKIATNQIGLSGLADLNDMLEDGFSSRFPGWAARSIVRYVPYGGVLRSIAASLDPVQRRADKWTEGSPIPAIGEQIKTAVPGLRQTVPATQDLLGRPAENPQQGFGAIIPKVTTQRNDPLIRAYQDAGVDISLPPPDVDGVKLTPAQQRRYQQVMGRELQRLAGPSINGENWKAMDPGTRKMLLETFQGVARTLAGVAVSGEGGQRFNDDRTKAVLDKALGR